MYTNLLKSYIREASLATPERKGFQSVSSPLLFLAEFLEGGMGAQNAPRANS
jgi:hypothetical protein